ncbi:MAG: hypothetical protein SO101_11910 [Lachnospiraceae bacterium]|nr:hypothetical protein [Lachnospiraceae bacterium]
MQWINDFWFKELQAELMSTPEWAKAEHMEMNVPEKELWQYGGDVVPPLQKHRRPGSVYLALTGALSRFLKL